MNIAIVNGRVIDPATAFDKVAGVYVEDGRIAAIGRAPERFKIDRTLDAKGLIVAPGLVDLCARLRRAWPRRRTENRNEGGAGRRSNQCCVPAGHRPAAR